MKKIIMRDKETNPIPGDRKKGRKRRSGKEEKSGKEDAKTHQKKTKTAQPQRTKHHLLSDKRFLMAAANTLEKSDATADANDATSGEGRYFTDRAGPD